MSGGNRKNRSNRIPGLTPPMQKLVESAIRSTSAELARIERQVGAGLLKQAVDSLDLIAQHGDVLRMSSRIHNHIADSLQGLPDWPGMNVGLTKLTVSYIDQAQSVASQFDNYYHALLSAQISSATVASISYKSRAEIRIPLAQLARIGVDGDVSIGNLVYSAGLLARNLSEEMFSELDAVAWAANLAAVSSWSEYSLIVSDLVPDLRVIELPASCLSSLTESIAEAEDPFRDKVLKKLSEIIDIVEELRQSARERLPRGDESVEPASVRLSTKVVDSSRPPAPMNMSYEVVGGCLVVYTDMPVMVRPMSRREIVTESDVELDRKFLELKIDDDAGATQKLISVPCKDIEYSEPSLSTTLSWWLLKDDTLCVQVAVDGVRSIKIEYRPKDRGYSKEAQLLFLFLENYRTGLKFVDVIKAIYPEDAAERTGEVMKMLIMRVRSLVGEITASFSRAGCNPLIIPKSWGVKSVDQALRLRVAGVVRVEGREEANPGRTCSIYDEK